MDARQFDAWTRRRFGFAIGGGGLTILFGASAEAARKRRKKRKKRCLRLGETCSIGGNRRCCSGTQCDATGFEPVFPTVCCLTMGNPCEDPRDCCSGLGCCGPGGNTVCSEFCVSDRHAKANLGSVDPADMLERVRNLPISTWNYTSDEPSVRHIGPMAQDFAAAFGVGDDDRHIHIIDGQGVALAAIQGLLREVEALRDENAALATRLAALEARCGA
jgi:hypothetical protein